MSEINHFDELYPNRFIKAGNLGDKPVTVTISAVSHDNLEGDKGVEQKVILSFERTPKQLVLCKLNAHCIKAMFGAKVANWIGKKIALFSTDQIMPMPTRKGDDRYCVRVWGSPDIAADFSFEWRPPKRKALVLTMHATKAAARTEPPRQAPQATAAESVAVESENKPHCPNCGCVVPPELADEVLAKGDCPNCPRKTEDKGLFQ